MSGTTNVPGVCLVIRDGSKLLFVLREHTGWKDGDYALPGGHVEDNETFRAASCREAMEEIGLVIEEKDLKYLLTVHRRSVDSIRVDVYFEVTKWSGEARNMETEKHAKIEWLEADDLPENIADYMLAGLQAIAKDETYTEFGWQE